MENESEYRPFEVILKPVDSGGRIVLNSEIKVEGVDANFRPVRNLGGLAYRLKAGLYNVNVIFPGLKLMNFQVNVSADIRDYNLPQPAMNSTRRESRVPVKLPVVYRVEGGTWVRTRSVNLSSSGACLVSRQKKPDAELQLKLFLPIYSDPIECSARVRWNRSEGSPEMGLEIFLTDTVKSTLTQWLSDVSPYLPIN